MRENRPVIALDFPTFEDVKAFLAKFPADEKLCEDWYGALLCGWS